MLDWPTEKCKGGVSLRDSQHINCHQEKRLNGEEPSFLKARDGIAKILCIEIEDLRSINGVVSQLADDSRFLCSRCERGQYKSYSEDEI